MNYEIRNEPNEFDPTIVMESAYSTKDGGYIGSPEMAKHLESKGIAPELIEGKKVCSIGFSEREQKWYGWSHRAIFGFGVGHTVKKGDLNYIASTPEELIEDRGAFFRDISEACAQQRMAECQALPDGSGIRILHTPIKLPAVKSLDNLEAALEGDPDAMEDTVLFEDDVSIQKCGRGEWTAQTLDDARQMACDFADGVS